MEQLSGARSAAHDKSLGAEIEKHIGNGRHIDLVINTGNSQIACEISITTNVEHEISNIQKCLGAGFENIWIISKNNEFLELIRTTAQLQFNDQEFKRIQYLSIDDALNNVHSIKSPGSKTIRGRKVNLSWKEINPDEISRRQTAFAKSSSMA